MKRALSVSLCLLLAVAGAPAGEPIPRHAENLSLRNEVQLALDRALGWLEAQQHPDGSFGNAGLPGLTALPVLAELGNPAPSPKQKEPVVRALTFIRSQAHEDGAFYARGLATYNTALCLTALAHAGRPEDEALEAKARAYLAGHQLSGQPDDANNGGFGYGGQRDRADLSNTLAALEALRTYDAAHPASEKPPGPALDWKAAVNFVTKCQNLPGANPEPWASGDPDNRGGFIYYPGHSDAGEIDLGNGKKGQRSYGTMSYAGLLSYIYADLPRDDARLQAALEWVQRHYTLEQNPGLGPDGYYYYLQLLAKGLAASRVDRLTTGEGKQVDWAHDLGLKLVNSQSSAGTWVNKDSGRWMENDPVLVTSYVALTLEIVYRAL
jgi:squalene-hopene/tetraprenyl-beta-curcumene cyclase